MANNVADTVVSGRAIYHLLANVQNDASRNSEPEAPFTLFRSVTIQTQDGQRHSALSRELSMAGIGLVHNMNLPLQEVELTITRDRGYSVRIQAQIAWCRACGEGWYISGAQFLEDGAASF